MRGRSAAARDTLVLAVGSALNGLLAYVFFAVVTRALGADAAAPVSVLWAYWSFAAAALAFPLQHWAARTVTMTGSDHQVQRSLPAISVAILALSPLIGVLAWLAREPLFHRGDLWFPLLVVGSTVGSALTGLVRGMLQAHERFGAVATALVLENLVRVVVSLVLVAAGVDNPVWYGAGPRRRLRDRAGVALGPEDDPAGRGPRVTARPPRRGQRRPAARPDRADRRPGAARARPEALRPR